MAKDYSNVLHDAVENYYHYNPNTLMPLMMVALATRGKLSVVEGNNIPENSVCVLHPHEMADYDWVACDSTLKRKINKWIKDDVTTVAIKLEIGRSLIPIFRTFKQNDEKDVVQEHHHRIGRLVNHSSNKTSEQSQRQYATFILANALLNSPTDFLKECYLNIFNHMLVKSGLQPKRPRLRVANALSTLTFPKKG